MGSYRRLLPSDVQQKVRSQVANSAGQSGDRRSPIGSFGCLALCLEQKESDQLHVCGRTFQWT